MRTSNIVYDFDTLRDLGRAAKYMFTNSQKHVPPDIRKEEMRSPKPCECVRGKVILAIASGACVDDRVFCGHRISS